MNKHLWIVGDRAVDRGLDAEISVSCHRRLRGPFTGLGQLLEQLVPVINQSRPDLVWQHRFAILTVAPDLERITGEVPKTLTAQSSGEERTRYQDGLARRASHGVTELLASYAEHRGTGVLRLAFDDVHAADPTDQEFLAVLLRRSDPEKVHVQVGSTADPLNRELTGALNAYADLVHAEAHDRSEPRTDEELLREFVESDGASDDPAELDAWQRADPADRARLHDARAVVLAEGGALGPRLGAIPYHREHGGDPSGAGADALEFALDHCIGLGFYPAAVDLSDRGRALVDPDRQQQQYCLFSAKLALCVSSTEPKRAEAILNELRRRYALPLVHMSACYSIGILYTRFHAEAELDNDVAKALVQNAIALATTTEDSQDRAFYTVFHSNGLALVELNQGNPAESLRLISAGIERLDRDLPPARHLVHRTVLVHNRARVYSAMGLLDEALADFTTVVGLDPNYAEYLLDRGNLTRRRGDHAAAIADYEKAMTLSAPFPELYYNRGDARLALGDTDGALADFDYVLELEPTQLEARINRATLRLESGYLDGATADVEIGLAAVPGNAMLLCTRGLIAIENGDTELARDSFGRAIEVDPNLHAALVNSAVLDFEAGDHDSAVDKLTRALEIAGDDPDLLYNRGFAHQAAGRYALAVDDYTRALDLPEADTDGLLRQRELCYEALGGVTIGSR